METSLTITLLKAYQESRKTQQNYFVFTVKMGGNPVDWDFSSVIDESTFNVGERFFIVSADGTLETKFWGE